MDPEQPTEIGKYEILSVIGRGGMGVVYRAQDRLIGRQVAIKTVTEGFNKDAAMVRRFYGEAEKMGLLRHPNIITVYDLGEQDGFPYIVMEYVEGEPLDRMIGSDKPVSLIFKVRIMEQVCAALGYAHQHAVVHRDVKPANVIVRPDGVVKLLDFGIARQESRAADQGLTVAGGVIGTVSYMSPERLNGEAFDGRSDIFAAGVLLFQLLTGRLPFHGKEFVMINQLLNDRHPPLSEFLDRYPKELDGILDRALAKRAADRYQTAEEMSEDLCLVVDSLKEEYASRLLTQAERLVSETDFAGGRESLFQLLQLDPKNTQARRMLAELNQRLTHKGSAEVAAALAAVAPFASAGQHEQVVGYIERLPEGVRKSLEIHSLLATSQRAWTQEWNRLGALGRAYAALAAEDVDGMALIAKDNADSPRMRAMLEMYDGRRTATVDRMLTQQMERMQAAKAVGGDASAEIAAGRKLLPFASPDTSAAWSSMAKQSGSGGKMDRLLARLGRRRA